jgi:hypothetical protein
MEVVSNVLEETQIPKSEPRRLCPLAHVDHIQRRTDAHLCELGDLVVLYVHIGEASTGSLIRWSGAFPCRRDVR